jgi:tripartite-type tricarboxylate transporter receptor subunit TctC
MTHGRFVKAVLSATAVLFATSAAADEVADFYAGKTVVLLSAAGGGGSYGVYGRLVADHIGRHIPGKPTVVAQFMPGAGGAKAANYVYNAAPRDGTVMAQLLKYVAVEQAIRRPSVKYDVRKFNWLISTAPINSVVAIWHTAPATTIEGVKKTQVVMGSTGKSSETYITPALMNAFLGTKFKIVTGYKGTGNIHIAMEQGELHGRAASWEGIVSTKQYWIDRKQIAVLAQSGLFKEPGLTDVPRLVDLAPDDETRAIFEFVGSGSTLGRVFVMPPGVPAPRVAGVQKAFDSLVKDPRFIAAAKKHKVDIAPRYADEIRALVLKTVSAPESVIARTKAAIK